MAPRERHRRATLRQDLSTREALDKYLENRPDLEPHAASLRQLAQVLEADVANQLRGTE